MNRAMALFAALGCLVMASLHAKPSSKATSTIENRQAGRMMIGAAFAPIIIPEFSEEDKRQHRKSDFYFTQLQKLAVGNSTIIQIWPCDAKHIFPESFDIRQMTIELPAQSFDELLNRKWIADNTNSRFVIGSNMHGLGRIHHVIDGELTITQSADKTKLMLSAKFKGVKKDAFDGAEKPTYPVPFEFQISGKLMSDNSIESMNEFTDCRKVLGIKIPGPCKKGKLCVMQ